MRQSFAHHILDSFLLVQYEYIQVKLEDSAVTLLNNSEFISKQGNEQNKSIYTCVLFFLRSKMMTNRVKKMPRTKSKRNIVFGGSARGKDSFKL